jgi:hypothetical protein
MPNTDNRHNDSTTVRATGVVFRAWFNIFALLFIVSQLAILVLAIYGGEKWSDVRDAVRLFIYPIVTLLGTAIGFYFGTLERGRGSSGGGKNRPSR